MTRHYYGRKQWIAWVLECRDSGMSVTQWCSEHGLSANQFFKWRRRLLKDGTIDHYPLNSRTSSAKKKASKHVEADVVQVNLLTVAADANVDDARSQDIHTCKSSSEIAAFSSEIVIEMPGFGCRVFVGNGFSQDTLRRVLEVVR